MCIRDSDKTVQGGTSREQTGGRRGAVAVCDALVSVIMLRYRLSSRDQTLKPRLPRATTQEARRCQSWRWEAPARRTPERQAPDRQAVA